MKDKIFKIFMAITLTSSFSVTNAQFDYGFDFSKAGSSGLQFLKIGVGARETALGDAASAIVDNANAVFWNPAGIAYVEKKEVSFSHNSWLVDSKHNAAVIAFPLASFVIGISAISLDINPFEETTALQPDGTGRMVKAGDLLFALAAARRFTDRLSIGLQLKYVNEKLDDYSLNNVLFDIGTIYYTGFRQLKLGFALQHFGPDMKLVNQVYRTPLLFRVSAADELFSSNDLRFMAAAELVHPTDNNEWVNFGIEGTLINMVKVRGGYRINNDIGKFSFGLGVTPAITTTLRIKIDYSYTPSEIIFTDIQRITIGLEF